MVANENGVALEKITDAVELAEILARHERFKQNLQWFEDHGDEVYSRCRGKCICIAGQELFVAETPDDAVRLARQKHPHDDGRFVQYVPVERGARIYAHSW